MPEKTTLSRAERAFCLSDAVEGGQIVRVFCHYCRQSRRYLPADLIELLGDLPAHSVADRMRCETCNRTDYVAASCENVHGGRSLRVRRLLGVRTTRVPIWSEEEI